MRNTIGGYIKKILVQSKRVSRASIAKIQKKIERKQEMKVSKGEIEQLVRLKEPRVERQLEITKKMIKAKMGKYLD